MFRKLITTKSLFLVRIGLCALSLAATPAAASSSPFDGSWSVKIVTSKGTCDSGATVPIRVTNGAIASDLSIVKASGQVVWCVEVAAGGHAAGVAFDQRVEYVALLSAGRVGE